MLSAVAASPDCRRSMAAMSGSDSGRGVAELTLARSRDRRRPKPRREDVTTEPNLRMRFYLKCVAKNLILATTREIGNARMLQSLLECAVNCEGGGALRRIGVSQSVSKLANVETADPQPNR